MKRRILSAALTFAVLGTGICPIYAADEKVIETAVFDSFGGYVKEYTDGQVEAFPDGFGATAYNYMKKAGATTDDSRSGKVVKLGTGASMLLPIGKVFTVGKGGTGWMHLSFDVKLKSVDGVETSKNKKFQLMTNTGVSEGIPAMAASNNKGWVNGSVCEESKVYDVDDPNQIPGQYPTTVLNVGADNLGRKMEIYHAPIYNQWNTGSTGATRHLTQNGMSADTWHKFDVYIRQTNAEYVVYMDGNELETFSWDDENKSFGTPGQLIKLTPGWWDKGENKVKGFEFRSLAEDDYCYPSGTGFPGVTAVGQTSDNDGGAFLVDNVYMKYYTTTEEQSNTASGVVVFEAPEITVDDNGGEGVATSNGKISVGFSEWMSSPATKSNVSIYNRDTGSSVTNFTIENSDNMQFDVVFGNSVLDSGNYIVKVSGLTGTVSNKTVSATAEFKTGADVEIVDNQNIIVPRVDSSEMVTYEEKTQSEALGYSSGIEKIRLNFSTEVSTDGIEDKITLKSKNESLPYTISTENGGKTVVVTLTKFMKADTDYTLTVDGGVVAAASVDLSRQVTMRKAYKYSFKTKDDPMVQLTDSGISKRANKADITGTAKLLITDNEEHKYTIALGVYEDVNGVKTLTRMFYTPIEIGADDRGIFECSVKGTHHLTKTTEIKLFIMDYPTNRIVKIDTWTKN